MYIRFILLHKLVHIEHARVYREEANMCQAQKGKSKMKMFYSSTEIWQQRNSGYVAIVFTWQYVGVVCAIYLNGTAAKPHIGGFDRRSAGCCSAAITTFYTYIHIIF